ncbi:phosphoribosyl transferase domain protein [Cercophora scortea]|uniref:Phosphoribosyl transferase domain protein n=1 Tax=Cercophora scortea TaxID=314031 RepID=A0AAE0J6Y0_9PEZI|nr:phosphoribosyl transferase domain protein [Cercophora scortea]
MATLTALKQALKAKVPNKTPQHPLSEAEYAAGFSRLVNGSAEYKDFIAPQLARVLTPLFNSRNRISVLEIGPGAESVLCSLPENMRRKITRYVAYEPNNSYAAKLEELISPAPPGNNNNGDVEGPPFLSLAGPPVIHRRAFTIPPTGDNTTAPSPADEDAPEKDFDVILFCHSLYGMNDKHAHILAALDLLIHNPADGLVIVFHRDDGTLDPRRLLCRHVATYPSGVVRVRDTREALNAFCSFIAGFSVRDGMTLMEWRAVCRAVGHRDEAREDGKTLVFSAPGIMLAFGRNARQETLSGLRSRVEGFDMVAVKNKEARRYRPSAVMRPESVEQVQECVRWALENGVGLTVVGGGHSGHCVWPYVVAVSMRAFNIVSVVRDGSGGESGDGALVVAGSGCTTRDIVNRIMDTGLVVPLGSRPSVGAGLWLQGGIGHLARQYGLSCDAVVGAVLVRVDSGDVVYVGQVPGQHRPAGATRAENEEDILWALKGAGTNFAIVVSVVFKAFESSSPAPIYYGVWHWVAPLSDNDEAQRMIAYFDVIARELPRQLSSDAFLFWDEGRLHLGVSMYGPWATFNGEEAKRYAAKFGNRFGQTVTEVKKVDTIGLFETDMYMSEMHGGHAGGKTSSFKRCVFLDHIGKNAVGKDEVAKALIAAMETRPSPLCYLHLLHGGGAVRDTAPEATAFGCRKWEFACVITGVWPRDQDGTQTSRAAIDWVYNVVHTLLPPWLSSGVYGADLGPDPRDAALARKAFGPNRPRLARLKQQLDRHNVLVHTCPLPKAPMEPKLILLVTGESGVGKDTCAELWIELMANEEPRHGSDTCNTFDAASISKYTKMEYAAAHGASLYRLNHDRAYKEQRRPALTAFFKEQVKLRPKLPEEHFLRVVYDAANEVWDDRHPGTDVLFITGMRDEDPVAKFCHLVPDSRVLEVRITASREARESRGVHVLDDDSSTGSGTNPGNHCRPTLVFDNSTPENDTLEAFATEHLFPLLHPDLEKLASMIRTIPGFPHLDIDFRHVLDIAQQPGGLSLCASLLQSHFSGTWSSVNRIVCCEAGGFVFASALGMRVDTPLALIRKGPGKMPPPRVSVAMEDASHISSRSSLGDGESSAAAVLEMESGLVAKGDKVVVVDDVLATGKTLCAVLRLLVGQIGLAVEDVSVLVVAEFPVHRGRDALRRNGFGGVGVRSLMVFGGA